MTTNASQKTVGTEEQYSLAKILGIWAAAALPMAVLSWIVFPLVAPDFVPDPLGAGVTRVTSLIGFYHLHQPWGIPTAIPGGVLFYALPAWRFRTTWMAIIVHSAQSVYLAFLILDVVPGLA
jgi:hypothetical protein